MPNRVNRASLRLFLVALTLPTPIARATLGEKEAAVATLQKTLGAERHAATTKEKFTVNEIANGGLTVREYSGKDGTIFGVAWDGLTQPDLEPILGTYYADFAQGAQQGNKTEAPRHARRQPTTVHGDKVTVFKWGHMRSAHGKAYIASLLPEGVTPDDIR